MKTTYLVILLIGLIIQNFNVQNNYFYNLKKVKSDKEFLKLNLLKNADNFQYAQSQDTSILMYNSFLVKKRLVETYEEISIYNKTEKRFVYDDMGYYFMGIKNDRFAIFDSGTSNARELIIYDLHEEKEIFKIEYRAELSIKDNYIQYNTPIQIKDEKLKAQCPEWIEESSYKIYLEEQVFDFKNQKVIHTGKYICSFEE